MSQIKRVTEELVEPILIHYDLELFDIEYVKEGQDWFLRVFIDKESGVTLEECELVSTELSEKLDDADIINGAYFLEVSSPGVERPLKTKEDFQKSVGKNVYVTLYVHIDGEKEFQGVLQSFDNDIAMIEYQVLARKKIVEIPYDKIAKARLAVAL
ncbi:MAG TPA: ribosome maturation factor RimP [Bacillota bacterium]|nr:ribosome maturation factor RimP [Bacillota bacterium]